MATVAEGATKKGRLEGEPWAQDCGRVAGFEGRGFSGPLGKGRGNESSQAEPSVYSSQQIA